MIITSTENNKIKELCKLNNKKSRMDRGLFIVEGEHLVDEALKNNILKEVYSLNEMNYSNEIIVSSSVMKKITSLNTIPRIIGVCELLKEKELGNKILILDNIQDPGNLGTIIRSAVAFSIDTIVLSNNSVDLYNPKVLRASEGMIFNINIISRDLLSFIPILKENNYKIYGTNVINGFDIKTIEVEGKYAIIMGNEGSGIRKDIADMCDENIYINMNKKCESINVGVATSIILYELDKR